MLKRKGLGLAFGSGKLCYETRVLKFDKHFQKNYQILSKNPQKISIVS
jgi:hypothetical protein